MRSGVAGAARAMAAVTLLVALALAGCGGDDAGRAAPPAGTAASGSPAPRPTAVVTSSTGTGADTQPGATAPATTAATTGPSTATSQAATVVDLHTVDLAAAVAAEPRLRIRSDTWSEPGLGPYVEVVGTSAAGYAALDHPTFADLSGDGRDEAVVALSSGGTAGGTGVLVFTGGPTGAVLVVDDALARSFGYKTSFEVGGGMLTLTNVVGGGWEPNCCWSGVQRRRYRLRDGVLSQVGAQEEEGVAGVRALTVERFYADIDERLFEQAYAFLAPTSQAREPFDSWRAGFATTVSVRATVDPLADTSPGPVHVRLDAVDRNADGTQVAHCYRGTWSVVYDTGRHQWLLDQPAIQLGC